MTTETETETPSDAGTEIAIVTVSAIVSTDTATVSAAAGTEETPTTTTMTKKKHQSKPPRESPATDPAARNVIITIMSPTPGTGLTPLPTPLLKMLTGEHPTPSPPQHRP